MAESFDANPDTVYPLMLRGMPPFEWFEDLPELAAVFNKGMTSVSKMETPVVIAAYDFSRFGTIVDIGGGTACCSPRSCANHPTVAGF